MAQSKKKKKKEKSTADPNSKGMPDSLPEPRDDIETRIAKIKKAFRPNKDRGDLNNGSTVVAKKIKATKKSKA
ncbi:MAG: hypothetical protein GF307_09340 [candidate division Zixibacteria bacterium]|nr:hypothetical protein [candidate division Zixibacteria bacterium]